MCQLFKLRGTAKRLLSLTVATYLSMTLWGCLPPLPLTYWEGSAPGAKPAPEEGCNTIAGPKTDIQFTNEDLDLRIGAEPSSSGSSGYLALSVTVPEGKSAAFESDEIEWSTDIPGESRTLKLQNFWCTEYRGYRVQWEQCDFANRVMRPTDVMTGLWVAPGKNPLSYSTQAVMKGVTPEQTPDKFYVKVPAIRVGSVRTSGDFKNPTKSFTDAVLVEYPVITFTKTTGVIVSSITCG